MKMKKLYVKGMHCPSCEVYVEKELKKINYISDVSSNHKKQEIEFNLKDLKKEENLKKDINSIISKDGYYVQDNPVKKEINKGDLLLSFLIASVVFILFFQIQKIGIFNSINIPEKQLPTAFLLGIIASVSSCMAVVGGLILSLSAIYKKKKYISIFHISRIVAFFLLGGVLGLIGSSFTISPNFYFISGIILFFVMLVLGINLLDIFPSFKNLQVKLPKFLTKDIINNTSSPIIMGLITFFLPCGFTQSVQIISISSGSVVNGALIMLFFALGTFPALALISFGLSSALKKTNSSLLFKISGFLVLFFAIYNLISSLTSAGIITVIL